MVERYVKAGTLKEASDLLEMCRGRARVIAGGTDLVLDLKSGKYEADCLVDISGIEELKTIESRDGKLVIGAGVTHNEAAFSPVIRTRAAALRKASSMVGSNQIRNVSTLAGNVVSAQPAADSAVALVALGASARIVTGGEAQEILVEDLYEGVGKSRVDGTRSILTHFMIPDAGQLEGSAYVRLQQRKALALPMLCTAVWVRLARKEENSQEDRIEAVRIVMAPVGTRPVRALEAEKWLMGRQLDPAHENEICKEAGRLALTEANPRDSQVRGSKEYRLSVLPELVEEALLDAVKNARERGKEEGDERS